MVEICLETHRKVTQPSTILSRSSKIITVALEVEASEDRVTTRTKGGSELGTTLIIDTIKIRDVKQIQDSNSPTTLPVLGSTVANGLVLL